MANREHVAVLEQGIDAWNQWRRKNPEVRPDLARVEFESVPALAGVVGPDLSGIDLSLTDLRLSNLRNAILADANLREAYLPYSDLCYAYFNGCDLRGATMRMCRLGSAQFIGCDLRGADLAYCSAEETGFDGSDMTGANMAYLHVVRGSFDQATLIGCRAYGIATWDLSLQGTVQEDLVITPPEMPEITVDNLELAQFVYLLISNQRLRDVIDTITSKVVLILGRFTEDRKRVLDCLREALREYDLVPILFDFNKPVSRSFIETASTLAHMARFVIADFTAQGDVRREVPHIAASLDSVPIVPLLQSDETKIPIALKDLKNRPVVLECVRYDDTDHLIGHLPEIIERAEEARKRFLSSDSSGEPQ